MRLEISEYAAAGWIDTQIATAVGCSVWTIRKWRRRWRKLGHVGFTSQMGRPVTGLVSTFPHALKEAILNQLPRSSVLICAPTLPKQRWTLEHVATYFRSMGHQVMTLPATQLTA